MAANRSLSLLIVMLCACGATIGDPCTTKQECSGAICVNSDFAPGGSCSAACSLTDARSCPSGAVCVKDVLGRGSPGCMRVCKSVRDCRDGYVCKTEKDSTATICVGPAGI